MMTRKDYEHDERLLRDYDFCHYDEEELAALGYDEDEIYWGMREQEQMDADLGQRAWEPGGASITALYDGGWRAEDIDELERDLWPMNEWQKARIKEIFEDIDTVAKQQKDRIREILEMADAAAKEREAEEDEDEEEEEDA